MREGRRGDSRGGGEVNNDFFLKGGSGCTPARYGRLEVWTPVSPTLNESGYMYFPSPQKGNHFQSLSQGAHTNCEIVRMFG